MTPLKDPNQNPWYILMTLHGEQTGDEIDWELHEKNRKLWNAWACQGLSKEEKLQCSESTGVDLSEMQLSEGIKADVEERFLRNWRQRNPTSQETPPLPGKNDIRLNKLQFENIVVLDNMVFNDIRAVGAAFLKQLSCIQAIIGGRFDFSFAQFNSVASWGSSIFLQDVDFEGAIFLKRAVFQRTRFGVSDAGRFHINF